jgi:hypothetical protein
MGKTFDNPAVRPLDAETSDDGGGHRRPPRGALAVALLAAGLVIGWLLGSLGAGDAPVDADPAGDGATLQPNGETPTVVWNEAEDVPSVPAGLEYNGFSDVVEVDGTIYVIANWINPSSGATAADLWSSDDGLRWDTDPLVVGEVGADYDLVPTGNGLILTGTKLDGSDGLWQSLPGRSIDGSSWTEIDLGVPANLHRSWFRSAVTSEGETVITLIGQLDIWRDVIRPYLPDDVDIADPKYVYRDLDGVLTETSVVDGQEFAERTMQPFIEPPELVIADDEIWIHLITAEGEEVFDTVPLPEGTYPATTNPTLQDIPLVMEWVSNDGIEFFPVTGRNALPNGYFLPEPWEQGLVAAAYELGESFAPNEIVTLWTSQSGRAWQLEGTQPPVECSPFFIAVSGDRMHLTSETGTQCVRKAGSDWVVLDEKSRSAYTVGGPAGFIGYPDSFEYDTALFSRDGLTWGTIEIPGLEPYPTLSILEDRLLVLSVGKSQPFQPADAGIWVSEPIS